GRGRRSPSRGSALLPARRVSGTNRSTRADREMSCHLNNGPTSNHRHVHMRRRPPPPRPPAPASQERGENCTELREQSAKADFVLFQPRFQPPMTRSAAHHLPSTTKDSARDGVLRLQSCECGYALTHFRTHALRGSDPRRGLGLLEVVLEPQVRDLLLAHQPAQRVLQLHLLDEE